MMYEYMLVMGVMNFFNFVFLSWIESKKEKIILPFLLDLFLWTAWIIITNCILLKIWFYFFGGV